MKKITIEDILKRKGKAKITMLTCYDYSFAKILDTAGIDIILVGDSLANVILGMKQTRYLPTSEMFNHTRAVVRGVRNALVVADMPYAAYQKNPKKCVEYAAKFISLGANAVKIEWFKECPYVVKKLIKNKIPVMGHIGLTPQTAHLLGGYKVQGRDEKTALSLIKQAKSLQDLGVFSLVLECIPYSLAKSITKELKIPTIGIGAGIYCDGQVLVIYDILNLYKEKKPKFVRIYKDLSLEIEKAVTLFAKDVKKGKFPTRNESFSEKKKE